MLDRLCTCVMARQAAILAGVVPALCNALGDGDGQPLCVEVLTVLHHLVAADASGRVPCLSIGVRVYVRVCVRACLAFGALDRGLCTQDRLMSM